MEVGITIRDRHCAGLWSTIVGGLAVFLFIIQPYPITHVSVAAACAAVAYISLRLSASFPLVVWFFMYFPCMWSVRSHASELRLSGHYTRLDHLLSGCCFLAVFISVLFLLFHLVEVPGVYQASRANRDQHRS